MKKVFVVILAALFVIVLLFVFNKKEKTDIKTNPDQPNNEVVAVGDIACAPGSKITDEECQHQAVANLVDNPSTVLLLGDIQYPGDNPKDFMEFDQTWGKYKGVFRPVLGNHDYGISKARAFFDYFQDKIPEIGYYSFDLATWHIVGLDSNNLNQKQLDWLEIDLKQNNKKCTLVMTHHPRFSSGKTHGSNLFMEKVWKKLMEHGVEALLSGHEHNYERFSPINNLVQFVVGTGGRNLYYFGEPKPNSQIRLSEFGVLKLKLKENSYSWQFVNIQNQIQDSGEQNCL